jgi:hypothetical protein
MKPNGSPHNRAILGGRPNFAWLMGSVSARLAYAVAAATGAVLVITVLPIWALRGGMPQAAPPSADLAQAIIGQRYFLATPWHWPVLQANDLFAPWGVNIAFTDSNPLAVLIAKLLKPMLPPFYQVATVWLAVCWLLQPVAAVFALRSAGERRALPALCAAVMGVSLPGFVNEAMHTSLSSHFSILVMIGLYFRAVAGSAAAVLCAMGMLPLLLLVHPYLAFMDAAVMAAIPVTLALHGKGWARQAAAFAAACAAVAILAWVLGYTRGLSPGGYGFLSMNLLSPVYPAGSTLFPGRSVADIAGVPGQASSYAYVGAGLILLVVASLAAAPRAAVMALKRQGGLTAACVALFLLALSNRVYLGHHLLFWLHTAVGPLQMLRSSARLFWPVAYTVLIGSICLICATRPRLAMVILPVAAMLQFLDAGTLRALVHQRLAERQPWEFDPSRMSALISSARMLEVLPVFGCTPGHDYALMEPLWLGAETHIATNTMYVARIVHRQSCDLQAVLADPPAPGSLRVVQPGYQAALANAAWARDDCRMLGSFTVCTADTSRLAGLPPVKSTAQR